MAMELYSACHSTILALYKISGSVALGTIHAVSLCLGAKETVWRLVK